MNKFKTHLLVACGSSALALVVTQDVCMALLFGFGMTLFILLLDDADV